MNLDSVKVELIDWISQLKDKQAIDKLLALKKRLNPEKVNSKEKIFGSGKHIIKEISDDFNEPLDSFKDYRK